VRTDVIRPSVCRNASLNAVRRHQAGSNGRVHIPSLSAGSPGLPAFQRCVLDPQRQAAPSPQPRLVLRPVLHLERHLWDVVTAIGVVFVWHRPVRTRKGKSILPPLDRPSAPTPVRTALLPTEREPVPGRKSIGEKCQARQDKGQRRTGARQHAAMDRGVQPTEQSPARLVGLLLLWNTGSGIQSR